MSIKPIVRTINPFNAKIGTDVFFDYAGGEKLVSGFNVIIVNKKDETIIYQETITSPYMAYSIIADKLINGLVYSFKASVNFSDGTSSEYSDEVIFKTFDNPVLDITTIDAEGYVYNEDVNFNVLYSQAQNEIIKWYKFRLLDSANKVVKDFPIRYDYSDNSLKCGVQGLEKNKGYILEVQIETLSGIKWSTAEYFTPLYIKPSLDADIELERDESNGFVNVNTLIKKVTDTNVVSRPSNGKVDGNTYQDSYVNINENAQVSIGNLKVDKNSPYFLKTWFRNLKDNVDFMRIKGERDGEIVFSKRADLIVATKTDKYGNTATYKSNSLTMLDNVQYMLYVAFIGVRMEIIIKGVDAE